MKKVISSNKAPKAIGPYSQAILCSGELLFVSGQLALGSDGNLVSDDVVIQAEEALKNLGAILKEAGCDYSSVVKTTVYLADINDFGKVNEVYAEYFEKECPARAAFEVANLPKGAKVEIEAVACKE